MTRLESPRREARKHVGVTRPVAAAAAGTRPIKPTIPTKQLNFFSDHYILPKAHLNTMIISNRHQHQNLIETVGAARDYSINILGLGHV